MTKMMIDQNKDQLCYSYLFMSEEKQRIARKEPPQYHPHIKYSELQDTRIESKVGKTKKGIVTSLEMMKIDNFRWLIG